MGGRGASSGRYYLNGRWNNYGDEYHTILQRGNIKFVSVNEGSDTAPRETRTKSRIYVTVGREDNKLKAITFYDRKGKRRRQIDLTHSHPIKGKKVKPHVHRGYNHDENGSRGLSLKEQKTLARLRRIWENYNKQR